MASGVRAHPSAWALWPTVAVSWIAFAQVLSFQGLAVWVIGGSLLTALVVLPLARAASQMSADVQRLHHQARSLRRRLVLATKDARLGPDLKAELAALSRDADEFFGRISVVLQE